MEEKDVLIRDEEAEKLKKKSNIGREKACGCIIIENDKVLLIKQNNGVWGFPKGHVEGNETEFETAIREVKEETNIDVEITNDKRYVVEYITNKGAYKQVVFFRAKSLKNEIKPQEEEISEIKWADFDEAFDTINYENIKELFKKVLEDVKLTAADNI